MYVGAVAVVHGLLSARWHLGLIENVVASVGVQSEDFMVHAHGVQAVTDQLSVPS